MCVTGLLKCIAQPTGRALSHRVNDHNAAVCQLKHHPVGRVPLVNGIFKQIDIAFDVLDGSANHLTDDHFVSYKVGLHLALARYCHNYRKHHPTKIPFYHCALPTQKTAPRVRVIEHSGVCKRMSVIVFGWPNYSLVGAIAFHCVTSAP